MAKISYGRSVKPVVKDNARARRHMRRMLNAIECRKIEEKQADRFGYEQPEKSTKLKQVRTDSRLSRVEKALSIRSSKTYDSLDNCCLPRVAIFSVKRIKRNT
ncbi:hypothetical protein [Pantoea sp. UYEF8]|uniref:transcriptional antitermination N peptide n=1 Tax=Pantoea sp. UYEF8 TaxID=1756394 RepID=UPI003392C403